MKAKFTLQRRAILIFMLCAACAVAVCGQKSRRARQDDARFGPAVRAYLAYLRNEQEVVDDRVSRREVNRAYYVRNSNRIRALREMATRIALENNNDYLPELEAVSLDEFDQLFDDPLPTPETLRTGETLNYQLRFLGTVAEGREKFYLFARLDPYEQSELRKKERGKSQPGAPASPAQPSSIESATRPRRVVSP
ncbi:MAG: hypothetical protein LC754_04375 [Acidobacteria bacterium]|nr:hypothetical protein [Acidobacteriota bacterium]